MFKRVKITSIGLIGLIVAMTAGAYWWFMPRVVRYAVFAGYNPDGIISPYVITYLKGLNEVSNGVIYITDSPLRPEEKEKLTGLVLYTRHIRHDEYDWGSYKRGFNWLKNNGYLEKADEIIFANDSCYAPMTSFKPMFDEMSKRKDLAFWGDSQNKAFNPHVQSYFMVFRKPVFTDQKFAEFMNTVTHQIYQSQYITLYETKLTPYLADLGYKWDSFIPYSNFPLTEETDINAYPLTAIGQFNHQFLKRRTFGVNLNILESRAELLRYIKQYYPKRFDEISQAIEPHFIPEDLKEKK